MNNLLFKRWKRYVIYMAQWVFLEKTRGLDFTMRDTSLIRKTAGKLHGYSKTDEAHVRDILKVLEPKDTDRLLDVGCGKGAFLREAANYPFAKIAGLEIDERLVKIARRNFKILKLDNRIEIIHADAVEYENYKEYNVFFFFNPFEPELLSQVLDKLVKIYRYNGQMITVVYHNPIGTKVVEEHGFELVRQLYDKVKDYTTNIYILRLAPGL